MAKFRFTVFKEIKVPQAIVGLLLFCVFLIQSTTAQQIEGDTTQVTSGEFSNLPKNPKKATILSAIIPGAGQVYNGKSWKVPIIYGGFITDIYFIGFNNKRYQVFRESLIAFDEDPNSNVGNQFPNLNREGLVRNVNYWRRNRDLCYLLLGVIYALNLVDANVDAHLSGFDISDDLSLNVEPHYEGISAQNTSVGLSLKLNFK